MNNEVQVAIKPIKGNLPSNLGTYEKIGPHTWKFALLFT